MSTKAEELESRIRRLEEMQRVLAAVLALFADQDDRKDEQRRVIRVALGLE